MGIRRSVGKNKKSKRLAAAATVKREETVGKLSRARPRARAQRETG